MPKKILIFSLSYAPFIGGAEIAVKEITDRTELGKVSFDMITLRYDSNLPREELIGNIHVYRIGFSSNKPTPSQMVSFPLYVNKIFYPFLACYTAIKLHKKNNYNAFWSIMSYMGFPIVLFRMFYKKIPFILTLQEGDDLKKVAGRARIQMVGFLFKRIFRQASVVQAISHYLASFAKDMGHRKDVVVIPNGVDVAAYKKELPEDERDEIRNAWKATFHDICLITTSRLVEKNGVGDIIEALKHLPVSIRLIIVGDGPLRIGLEAFAANLGVSNRVLFLGSQPPEKIPALLHSADIFIRPSLTEGMGNSFIEAMAARLPVIATPVGGIVDFLKDKETGVFCEPKNPQSIVKAVNLLLTNQSLHDKIVDQAERMVKEKYDWNLIAQEMQQKVFNVV